MVLNSKKTGTLKRESHILQGRVQRTRHASRPQEGPRITEMTAPTDKQQLQSFLGMVNYMGTFIPNLSHHTEPLQAMLKKDNVFHWEDQQTRSFQQVKTLITKANITPLRYYDRNLPVTVQADASLRGLELVSYRSTRKGPTDCLCQQEPHGCHHQISTREGNATGRCPLAAARPRASQEIKLDMRVDYMPLRSHGLRN